MKNAIKNLSSWMKKHNWLTAVLFVIFLAGCAYLPLISKLGIYRDDWHMVFGGKVLGPQVFINMYSIDRPFTGWNYYWIYLVLGGRILLWNLFSFILRVAGALLFLSLIKQLWPTRPMIGLVMTSLFVVYPGFLQQSNGMNYTMHLLYTFMLILSLLASVMAFQSQSRTRKILFTLLALASLAYYSLLFEYVIGIEGFRLAILVYLVKRSQPGVRMRRSALWIIKSWWPYFLIITGFLVWRLFIFQAERITVDAGLVFAKYFSSPVYNLLNVAIESLQDFWEVAFAAWFVPFYKLSGEVRLKQLLFTLGFGLIAAIMTWVILFFSRKSDSNMESSPDFNWHWDVIWMGAVGLIISILPVVVSGRNVMFEDILTLTYDHYALHSAPSAIFLVGGILYAALNSRWRSIWVIPMVGMAVTTQLIAGTIFANAWENTRQFWWQISWRVPQLQQGTLLLAGYPEYSVILEEYQVSYPANLMYYPDSKQVVLGSAPLLEVNAEKVITGAYEERTRRKVPIFSDYEKTLIAYFPTPNSCLHLVDGEIPILSSGSDPLIQLISPYSHLAQVDVNEQPHLPPKDIFGDEPIRGWCYYFQTASLAVQQADWPRVIELETEALAQDLKPVDPAEWIPFLYAYVNTGDEVNAKRVISYFKDDNFLQHQVCENLNKDVFSRLVASPEGREFLQANLCQW